MPNDVTIGEEQLETPVVSENTTFVDGDLKIDELVSDIPSIVEDEFDIWYAADEGDGTTLEDTLNNYDATLETDGDWRDDSDFVGGTGFELETDKYYISDDSFDLSSDYGGEVSFCVWFVIDEFVDRWAYIAGWGEDTNDPDTACWLIHDSEDNDWQLRTHDSGSTGTSGTISTIASTGQLYFGGAAVDGGNFDIFIWDDAEQVGSITDTSSGRNPIGDGMILSGFRRDDRSMNGVLSALGYSFGEVLSESEFEEIWEETKP